MTSMTGLFMAQLIAAMAPTSQAAISLFPVALFFSVAFAGYIVYIPQFDPWLRAWAPYGSFMRWGFQGLVLNEFAGNSGLPYSQEYINNLGFYSYSKEQCAPLIIIFSLIFSNLELVALKYVNFEER